MSLRYDRTFVLGMLRANFDNLVAELINVAPRFLRRLTRDQAEEIVATALWRTPQRMGFLKHHGCDPAVLTEWWREYENDRENRGSPDHAY